MVQVVRFAQGSISKLLALSVAAVDENVERHVAPRASRYLRLLQTYRLRA